MKLEHYVTWIESMEWDYFATFTTAYEMKPIGWRKRIEIYHSKLDDARIFWVVEKGSRNGKFHIHALIKSGLPREVLFDIWQMVTVYKGQKSYREDGKVFNRTQIDKRDPRKKAASYMFKDSKYTMKNMFKCDYDLLV